MLSDFKKHKFQMLFKLCDRNKNQLLESRDYARLYNIIAAYRNWPEGSEHFNTLRNAFLEHYRVLSSALGVRDGSITPDAWLTFAEALNCSDVTYQATVTASHHMIFSFFDVDEDGRINLKEWLGYWRCLGLDTTQAPRVFEWLDRDHDGFLSRDELSLALSEFFRGDDPTAPGTHYFGFLDAQ